MRALLCFTDMKIRATGSQNDFLIAGKEQQQYLKNVAAAREFVKRRL